MDFMMAAESKDLLSLSQAINLNGPYPGDTEFTDIKTPNLEAEFYRLSDQRNLPVLAMVHAPDTEARIGQRPTAEKVTFKKLLFKKKINQTESFQLLKSRGVAGTQDIMDFLADDVRRLARDVKARTAAAKMEVLGTGKMTVNENDLNFSVDYNVPADNFFTLDWDDPDHDILGDIQSVVVYARSIGKIPTRAKTSNPIIMKIQKNTAIQKAIGGVYMQGVLPQISQINALFMVMFGITITTDDNPYSYESDDGSLNTGWYFKRNTFSIYTVNAGEAVGIGLWGPTIEEEAYGPWTAKSAQQFITITQWTTPDPVALWTKASAMFIPILPDPKGLFILTVSSDVLAPLTVTSAAGSTTGTTHVTVSPALTSGNIYKYKTAANPTLPVFNQLISGGYTNWDGAADITASTGQKIVVVEVTANGHARKAGMTTVTAK